MEDKSTNKQQDDNPYTKEEYEKDLIYSDVVMGYQKMLTEKLGYPVTLDDADYVAYSFWSGTSASRTEEIRQKYGSPPIKDSKH